MVFTEKENTKIFKIGQKLIEKINQKANIDIKLIYLPRKRAQIELFYGELIQADLSRIFEFQELNPTLIRIKENIGSSPLYVYTHNSLKLDVSSWKSLKEYKIVYVRGTRYIKKFLNNHKYLHSVSTNLQAFRFLSANRADIHISLPMVANPILNSKELKNHKIKVIYPPIDYIRTYTFFNQGYEKIAKKFEKALIEIKEDGTYDEILMEINRN